MRTNALLTLILIASQFLCAQTTLEAGDIAILQYNSDNSPETIKFISFRSMESGTTITFTDNGWQSDNTFRMNEGFDTWTASSNIVCGQIITFDLTNANLAASGDQLLAFQGSTDSPTFLFAINNEGAATWQATAADAQTSALPLGLTDGVNAVAITEIDNAKYDSSTLSGTKSALLTAICTAANWSGSNTVNQTFSDTFTSEITWTGSWSGSGNPSDYLNIVLDSDYNTSTSGNFSAGELQINATRTLTIASSNTVTIQNSITNSGNIVIQDGGSIIQETADATNSGTGYRVERASQSQQEEGDFTYWSSPLTSATLADVADAQYYYSYNASTQSWSSESSTTAMVAGVGYAVMGDQNLTYPNSHTAGFSGSGFNNGDINVSLSFSNDADDTNDWNFIGNPYPSAIDADTFLNDNSSNVGGTIYFWTHNTADSNGDNTSDDYAMYNTTGGVAAVSGGSAPDGNIASGQGFFAQATASANAVFTNIMRVSGNNSSFFRSNSSEEQDRIWLNLTSQGSFSQILIGFIEGATDGYDRSYDGKRMASSSNSSFYSLEDGIPFGIQGRSPFTDDEVIPLGMGIIQSGEFTISIDNLEGKLEDLDVLLNDKLLNQTHDLKESDYSFSLNETGAVDDRFELLIAHNNTTLSHDETMLAESQLTITQENNLLTFQLSGENKKIETIVLYTLLGKQISRTTQIETATGNAITIPILKAKPSLMIARVTLDNGAIISKKILYH